MSIFIMELLAISFLIGFIVYILFRGLRKKRMIKRIAEIGAIRYDQIMKGGARPSTILPPADLYACAVGAIAANAGVINTFVSKGEPLAKYNFRMMIQLYLPPKYKNDPLYSSCGNMEATIFWISYMERFFLESLSNIYKQSEEWNKEFHEYYWKFSIFNMMIELNKSDIPVFLAKLQDASFASSNLTNDEIEVYIRRGCMLPDGFTCFDDIVFEGYSSIESSRKIKSIISSNIGTEFREKAEQQAKLLVSLFVPEEVSDVFDLQDDMKVLKIVDQSWATMSDYISIPPV